MITIADIIHLDQIMKIIQLQIYLFMLYRVTESLTNTPVTLGSDVIITCDLDIKEIYWYKLKLPDPPVLILRTFSRTVEGGGEYENSIFIHKYSVKTNSRLFIKNITIDELGVYYCVKTSEPLKFNNGTKIYISDSVHRNQTDDAPQHQIPWRNMTIIISVLLNVLLIIALIGVVKNCRHATRTSKNSSEKPPSTTAAQVFTGHESGVLAKAVVGRDTATLLESHRNTVTPVNHGAFGPLEFCEDAALGDPKPLSRLGSVKRSSLEIHH
ncbi:uncharacterized protein LOC130094592 [Rhinichthys klamathensis goyatoka]|uniref:uncharacterized protein LOC130094592 n=1 Tax=Rhinichthys klamathensis goyatoka TaxID=3034132 RepID=UPI0024B54EA4|nr:uncharacterized protein LOC130094592 [Rhinichthys klamathensis goyatoka]